MDQHTVEEDGLLPSWAIGHAYGHLVIGAQLPTKDGRRTGNGTIISIEPSKYLTNTWLYIILTDAGNVVRMIESEVLECFYPPEWISNRQFEWLKPEILAGDSQ